MQKQAARQPEDAQPELLCGLGRGLERGGGAFLQHLLRFVLYRSALAHSLIRSYARSNLAQRDVDRVLLD